MKSKLKCNITNLKKTEHLVKIIQTLSSSAFLRAFQQNSKRATISDTANPATSTTNTPEAIEVLSIVMLQEVYYEIFLKLNKISSIIRLTNHLLRRFKICGSFMKNPNNSEQVTILINYVKKNNN